jgi:hypothetical protein
MLEGLTPDGYDREGRKVSFVETGKPFRGSGRGLSGILKKGIPGF